MLRFPLDKNSESEAVDRALEVLKLGGIIAYPTESFYALGVMANDENAVSMVYSLKKRPGDKAMPVIVGGNDVLKAVVENIPPQAEKLMKKFWPGPLTLIFNAKGDLPELLTGFMGKVAVRTPGESFALCLAKTADFPITATSANHSGSPPAQRPDEVINYFGEKIDLIVDAGTTPGGKPSTIVDVTVSPPKVLRKGRVLLETER